MMTREEEIQRLEAVFAGHAEPYLDPAASCGRLAELYLQTPKQPGRAQQALIMLRAGLRLIEQRDPLVPKLRHFEAMAMRYAEPEARAAAADIERAAWKVSLAQAPTDAIASASEWGDWAWDNAYWDEAGEAYSNARQALFRHIRRGVHDDTDRLNLLGSFQFATRRAYALAQLGKAQEAILLLERSSDLLSSRHKQEWDLARLSREHPALFAELEGKRNAQRRLRETLGLNDLGNLSQQERATQDEIDQIVLNIRKLPGFASFALPPQWSDVEDASVDTPLAYIVATDKGSAAFVVIPGAGQRRQVVIINDPFCYKPRNTCRGARIL
jgi:tetratricopeptide (TPR) repeat protein